jgi:hypothetical protein
MQTSSEARLVSYPMGVGGYFPRAAEVWRWSLTPYNAEVKNE